MFTADNDASITARREYNIKLGTNLKILRDSPGSWGYHYRNQETLSNLFYFILARG